MTGKTSIMGAKVFKFETLPSTNTFLMQKIKIEDLLEGTVIWAFSQTAGRGQRGNIWLSDAGKNLTFSLLLKPDFIAVKNQFLISMAFSVAVVKCLTEKYNVPAVIKWPNDIYIENKKVGGMLIENVLSGDVLKYAVIGLGLNVNQQHFTTEKTTALSLVSGHTIEIETLLNDLLFVFEEYYFMLRNEKYAAIKQSYFYYLKGYKEFLSYKDMITNEIIMLKIVDVLYDGTAIFSSRDNEKRTYRFKEIALV